MAPFILCYAWALLSPSPFPRRPILTLLSMQSHLGTVTTCYDTIMGRDHNYNFTRFLAYFESFCSDMACSNLPLYPLWKKRDVKLYFHICIVYRWLCLCMSHHTGPKYTSSKCKDQGSVPYLSPEWSTHTSQTFRTLCVNRAWVWCGWISVSTPLGEWLIGLRSQVSSQVSSLFWG